jgi:hypothetical protein
VEDVQAGLYGLDRSLSANQVLLLRDAFLSYDRPALQPLKGALFGRDTSIVVMDRLEDAAGMNFTGTRVIILDRRDLFGNKYQLAQVMAHEASHILQGELKMGDICTQLLQREVGDRTVPADLLGWDAERLLEAVESGAIGAYHVSLWVLARLGVRDVQWLYQVIQNGSANGQSLLIGCSKD